MMGGTSFRRKAVPLLLAGIMLGIAGCSLLPKEEEVLKPPLAAPRQESYNLYEVKRGSVIRRLKGSAVFESARVLDHEFKGVTGVVKSVAAKTGDTVKKGAPLITLDTEGMEITELERVRDLEKAKLALKEAEKGGEEQLAAIRRLELEIARIRLEDVRKQLAGKVMTAGMDGAISFMEQVLPGDTVQKGKVYVTLVDPGALQLAYSASGSDSLLREVQPGMQAEITYRDRMLEGTVTQSPSSAPTTGNKPLADQYARTLYFKLSDPSVKPELGEAVDFDVILQKKEHVVVVPRSAVSTNLGRTFVKVKEGNSIKEADIETGLETSAEIEVVKGLKEGQWVILP